MSRIIMNSSKRKSESTSINTALTSVALQDHLMRSLSLGSSLKPLGRGIPRNKAPAWKKNAKAVVNTRRGKQPSHIQLPSDSEKQVSQEYVLDPKPIPLTLAQKLGLVESPPQPLSEVQWGKVKQRSNKREDFKEPCVICKEDFGLQQQVLLSCSHVFHKTCLQAFERFTGKKSCPMCRQEQYQTRVIHEGANYHLHQCATVIQTSWRGYIVRCWYLKLRETIPPTDPHLRKKFYEKKLHDITDRMVRSLEYDVDRFLSDIDQSVEASREVFRQFEEATKEISDDQWDQIQLKAVERGESDCPICLTALGSMGLVAEASGLDLDCEERSSRSTKDPTTSTRPSKLVKKHIPSAKRAVVAGQGRRSLGGRAVEGHSKGHGHSGGQAVKAEDADGNQKHRNVRQNALLSCSHVFHATCLQAFEEFSCGDKRNVCPVCRSLYQKKTL